MASREEMVLLRSARAGDARAQVELAKRYLFGGTGLPRNIETGLLWLDRAARKGEPDAWQLIGCHVPFEAASSSPDRHALCRWYERAFDDGVVGAGLVLARLVLTDVDGEHEAPMRSKAWRALACAAECGIAEAQWLLAQLLEKEEAAGDGDCSDDLVDDEYDQVRPQYLEWAQRAAENGVLQARRVLANHAWCAMDERQFLYWALPLANCLVTTSPHSETAVQKASKEDIVLLSRCVRALFRNGSFNDAVVEKYAEIAARAGDKQAQFYLGLWLAKLDEDGNRIEGAGRLVNYRRAVHWLTLAGQQGMAAAWYVASRIYLNVDFAYRSIAEARKYLTCAAEGGHRRAQLDLAKRLWRKRAETAGNDVLAVYWLQKAAVQGCNEAARLLEKCAAVPAPAPWAQKVLLAALPMLDPFTTERLKVAACFGLTDREALFLDIVGADRGHCLEVDIRGMNMRGKRRLILIQTAEERRVLDRAKDTFDGIECGPNGPEGNARERLYRLRRILRYVLKTDRASKESQKSIHDRVRGNPVFQGRAVARAKYRSHSNATA